jgi:hypothetical protein
MPKAIWSGHVVAESDQFEEVEGNIYFPPEALVPIAKGYCGLSEREMLALDRWIRRPTIERFGPLRQVVPEQVFEFAFEATSRQRKPRRVGSSRRGFPASGIYARAARHWCRASSSQSGHLVGAS